MMSDMTPEENEVLELARSIGLNFRVSELFELSTKLREKDASAHQQERDKLMAEVAMLRAGYEHFRISDRAEEIIEGLLSSTTSAEEWLAGKIKEAKRDALEHCAKYFDVLDETFPMTPPQIAASIRRQIKN
jgi:hypothetical protein